MHWKEQSVQASLYFERLCGCIYCYQQKYQIRDDKDAAGKTQSRNIGCTLDQFEDT